MISIDTFVLSLKHRQDRRSLVLEQVQKLQLNTERVQFFDAKFTPRNGAIGCASSHAFALSRFLFESDAPYCLILEDDFEVISPENFAESLTNFLTKSEPWDVLLLASNVAVPISATQTPNIFRVVHAQTTAAYLVTRQYAPTLIKMFFNAANYLSEYCLSLDAKTQNYLFAIDMMWKPLQYEGDFYGFLPPLVRQSASYSDIENNKVSYGV